MTNDWIDCRICRQQNSFSGIGHWAWHRFCREELNPIAMIQRIERQDLGAAGHALIGYVVAVTGMDIASARAAESDICWCRKNPCECLKHDKDCETELTSLDEMLKHLATEQGFTLNGIARLLIECQRRMAADWVEVGRRRREQKQAEGERDALREAREAAFKAGYHCQWHRDIGRYTFDPAMSPGDVQGAYAAWLETTLHAGGCNGLAHGDGNGQGADGVVYPGDPAHCPACREAAASLGEGPQPQDDDKAST